MKLLEPGGSYTFSKIFELKLIAEELAKEFDYSFARKRLNLPQYSGELDRITELQNRIKESLPYVNLSTETARRGILISPIILDLIHYTKAEVRIEYPIKVIGHLEKSKFSPLCQRKNRGCGGGGGGGPPPPEARPRARAGQPKEKYIIY